MSFDETYVKRFQYAIKFEYQFSAIFLFLFDLLVLFLSNYSPEQTFQNML